MSEYSNNRVVIGGLGMVGRATRRAFGIDDYYDLKGSTLSLKDIAKEKRYVFVCLPTPATHDSGHDISNIVDIIDQIEGFPGGQKVYIIRSTTTPGQCEYIMDQCGVNSLVHNPEFLTMSSWEQDVEDPDIIVIGSKREKYGDEVEAMYQARYSGFPIIRVDDTRTSEMIKLAINAFYYIKTIFANEVYDICQKTDIDYEKIVEAMYARKWIGRNHLVTPYHGKRGVGGKCLPKDMEALANVYPSKLFTTAVKLNEKWRG